MISEVDLLLSFVIFCLCLITDLEPGLKSDSDPDPAESFTGPDPEKLNGFFNTIDVARPNKNNLALRNNKDSATKKLCYCW